MFNVTQIILRGESMFAVLAICLAVITCIFGITQAFRMFWLWITRPKGDLPRIMIVLLKNDICIQQLQNALEYLNWEGCRKICTIAAVDCGLNEANAKKVSEFASHHPRILFGEEELSECLNSFCSRDNTDQFI